MQNIITFNVEVGGLKIKPFFSKKQAKDIAKENNGKIHTIIPEKTNSKEYLDVYSAYLVISKNEKRLMATDNNGGFTVSDQFISDNLIVL